MSSFVTSSCNKKGRTAGLYLAAAAFLLGSALLSISLGGTGTGLWKMLLSVVEGRTDSPEYGIFIFVRLRRTLAAVVCGAALATSGAVIQSVLANRLASPSIIGVNAGAGLAITLCTAMGLYGGWQLSAFAFAGALGAVLLVNAGAAKWGRSPGTVILMGVALSSLLGAVSDTVTTLVPEVGVMSNDFKMGDLSGATYGRILPGAALVIVTLLAVFSLSARLDVLSLGEQTARGLGMNTRLTRMLMLTLAALLAGCAVSIAGLLSFVGLLVPHAVRRLAGSRAGRLLPLCALFGGGFVTLCDTVARTVFTPYELPVGIIMAFLGAPFFLFILIKGRGGRME